ncbi:MAG: spiro-SPASM protein [Treponema sp.]|jgi:spiro-SPASM protein|nr:spiro-SPASM protein [Treponema sp.]
MNALLVLFGGNMSGKAFEPVSDGKNSLALSLERGKKFPGVGKTAFFAPPLGDFSYLQDIHIVQRDIWTQRTLLEKIAELQAGFDCAYFVFADCPFLDPALAGALVERHMRYAAEYSYADGWPYGLAPEILSRGTAGILAKIIGEDDGPVERDMLFSVIQKDINAFDIETEISPVDLRCHRISLCADSKRNMFILKNFLTANGGTIPDAEEVTRIVEEKPEILRTLPGFYNIQVSGGCPQKCTFCPYSAFAFDGAAWRKDFMDCGRFESLLDNIIAFSGDAVISLSLWGELSLHPEKMKLIEAVVSRDELALVIETSGLGWMHEELEKCAGLSGLSKRDAGKNSPAPLSWIVSLDTTDPKEYAKLRSSGFAEANECAKKLLSLFPKDCYVQAVRAAGAEDDIEKFYRYWEKTAPNGEKNIIIQKYDDFCGALEKKQASDISPVIRKPCWHIMRDMPVLLDGTVPLCREDISMLKETDGNSRILGNVFTASLETIWQNGERYYIEHCKKNYTGLCENCDEYYTFNF